MENTEITETDNFLDNLPPKLEMRKKIIGRPVQVGSGTMIISCSIPYGYKDLMVKYDISPSNAIKEGILMLLNNNPRFPENAYEELQTGKGLFVEKRAAFAAVLSKTV